MASNPTKVYEDFISTFAGGQNSGIAPLLLSKDQCAFMLNISLRGGYAHTRPPVMKKNLNFQGDSVLQALVENGLFQGGGYYRPDFGTESLVAQIAGHLIQFVETGSDWIVNDISVPGDPNDPSGAQAWMWQSEKWLIENDGSGRLPIFWDGSTSRRSQGDSVQVGNVVVDFIPPPIGGTVVLTLDAPYTGLYNVPIILNGAFYQALSTGSSANSYPAILTNVNDTAGVSVATGTQVKTNPALLGFLATSQSFPAGSLFTGSGPFNFSITGAFTGAVGTFFNLKVGIATLGPFLVFGATPNPTPANPSQWNVRCFYEGTRSLIAAAVPAGASLVNSAPTAPVTIIGNLAASFNSPSIGTSVTVLLTVPYSGNGNQIVTVNGKVYEISAVPPSPPTSQLTVINLTDTTNNPEPQYPVTVPQPQQILTVPELPAGRMGAYGMARNWFCLVDGISYAAGDIVGGASGTEANSKRDSVLKMTENTFLAGGGTFRLPGSGDQITAMCFPPILDKSLGQGELQIGTSVSCFSNNSPIDRAIWETLTSPLQTESLKDNGPIAQNSTVLINSDMFFRSFIGWASLIQARRDFNNEWGNKGISNEMQRPLQADNQSLLPFGSAMSFDNRFLGTCGPNTLGAGTFHTGLTTLNLDLISSLRGTIPPAWEGAWTGINALQVISGRVNGNNRAFAFTYNINTDKIELYEMLSEASANQQKIYKDNNETQILSVIETSILFNKDVKSLTELVELIDGEMYLSDITSTVNVKVFYRPDFYPCWTPWREFDICADDDNTQGDGNKKPGYRMRIGLGTPSPKDCEPGNNRPLRVGYFHQVRIEFTGYCVFRGLRVRANSQPISPFAKVQCDPQDCQLIDCEVPDDLQIYSLQGFLPRPLPQDVPAKPRFHNQQVVYENICQSGQTLAFSGTTPSWITIDFDNNKAIGRAGTFGGQTQAEANATAQASLNQFVTFNLANGEMACTPPPPPVPTPDKVWYKYPEGSGATTADFSAAGNNGQGITGWTAGPGSAAAIISPNGVHAAGASTWGTSDFSYSIWIKPSGTPGTFYPLVEILGMPSFNHVMDFAIDSTNKLTFMALYGTPLVAGGSVLTSVWQMATFTFNSTTGLMSLYLNGALVASASALNTFQNGTIYIGGDGAFGHPQFAGDIADTRIWSVELTAQNVLDLFNAGAQ